MEGQVGDRLIVNSRRVGQPVQEGEIVSVVGGGPGRRRYLVRWLDGRESVICPGTDVTVVEAAGHRPSGHERRSVTVDLRIEEDRDHCEATATMGTAMGAFTGIGHARRHPGDPLVPMIGEELAIARSLADLAAKLREAADHAMASHESRRLHLIP